MVTLVFRLMGKEREVIGLVSASVSAHGSANNRIARIMEKFKGSAGQNGPLSP